MNLCLTCVSICIYIHEQSVIVSRKALGVYIDARLDNDVQVAEIVSPFSGFPHQTPSPYRFPSAFLSTPNQFTHPFLTPELTQASW
jgi:hypothetical protein